MLEENIILEIIAFYPTYDLSSVTSLYQQVLKSLEIILGDTNYLNVRETSQGMIASFIKSYFALKKLKL